ncbi:MAG: hypothetical protein ACREHD_01935 [Pirellulales bacterium]
MHDTERITEYLNKVYHGIWGSWFDGVAGVTPADFIVEFCDGDDGYNPDTHVLRLRLSEANRDDVLEALSNEYEPQRDPTSWPG